MRFIIVSLLIHAFILSLHFKSDEENIFDKANTIANKGTNRIYISKIEYFEPKKKSKQTKADKKNKIDLNKKGILKRKKHISFKDLSLDFNKVTISKKTKGSELAKEINKITEKDIISYETIRGRYYSFFKRVHDRVGDNWRLQLRDKFFNKRLTSKLLVKLDKEGKIISLAVRDSSGNIIYDDTTLNAFRRAAPFINPPKDLIKNGYLKFEWAFILY